MRKKKPANAKKETAKTIPRHKQSEKQQNKNDFPGRPADCNDVPKKNDCLLKRKAFKGRPGTSCHRCRAI